MCLRSKEQKNQKKVAVCFLVCNSPFKLMIVTRSCLYTLSEANEDNLGDDHIDENPKNKKKAAPLNDKQRYNHNNCLLNLQKKHTKKTNVA